MIGYVVGLMERDRKIYHKYLSPCLKEIQASVIEVWAEGDEGLAAQYNRGFQEFFDGVKPVPEIIAFIHPDVIILDHDFEEKIQTAFSANSSLGVVGVLGATYLPENSNWWSASEESLRGHIIQEYEDKPTKHLIKGVTGYYEDLICADGLFLAVRSSLLSGGLRFEETFPNYLHTDTDICFSVIKRGYKIAVVDTLLLHKSEGKRADSQEWQDNRKILFRKWKKSDEPSGLIKISDLM